MITSRLKLLAVALFFLSFVPTQLIAEETAISWPLRLNVGSSASYTAANGVVYWPDQPWDPHGQVGYVGGTARAVPWWNYVGGTSLRQLHQTQRDNWERYIVGGIPNGRYLVTLHFSEQTVHGPNLKQFDLLLEGITRLSNLDLAAEVGRDYAYIRRFETTVFDGQLVIGATGASSLAALEVVPIDEDGVAPPVPTAVTAAGGYQAVLLDWADSTVQDIDGYYIYRSPFGSAAWQRMTSQLVYESRYEAADVGATTYQYAITAVDVWGNESGLSTAVSAQPLSRNDIDLPIFDLTLSTANLATLQATPFSESRVTGLFTIDGQTYPVETRFRGWLGRHFPKKSWKVVFPGDSPFPGQDRINLNADYADWSLLRGQISIEQFNQANVHAPQAEPIALFLNGEYMGVYTRYEQIDEGFLAKTGQNPDGTIYKVVQDLAQLLPTEADYRVAYEKETNRDEGYEDIIAFVELINNTPDETFPYEIAQALDVAAYLRYYATIVLISHLDFTWHNTYLVHDPEADLWRVVPWDFDFTWGADFDSQTLSPTYPINVGTEETHDVIGSNPLLTRILDVPPYRAYYCQQLDTFMQGSFSVPTMNTTIETAYSRLAAEGLADWRRFGWENKAQFTAVSNQMKTYVGERHAFLRNEMVSYCAAETRQLVLNELMVQNETAVCDPADSPSTNCHDQWIEFYNPSLTPIELNGHYLSNTAANRQLSRINGSLVVPPLGHVVVWADAEQYQGVNHTNFTLNDYGTIYLTAPDGSPLLEEAYSFMPTDFSNGRFPDGTDNWRFFRQPTPASSNLLIAPTITSVTHAPGLPQDDDEVTVTAKITDDGEFFTPILLYQVDGGGFTAISMTSLGGNFYNVTLPAFSDGARIEYYIVVQDKDSNVSHFPATAPDSLQEFRVNYVPPPLVINEFMASNERGLLDPQEPDEYPDWIEIYNPTPHTVDLGGFLLSDTLAEPDAYQFSDEMSIAPGGYLIVYADNDPEQGERHANFGLSADGEELGLFAGVVGQHQLIDSHAFGAQTADISEGRCPDGQAWQTLPAPTPNQANTSCEQLPPRFRDVSHQPSFPMLHDEVMIQANLVATGADIQVYVWYTSSDGDSGMVPMVSQGNNLYEATLPNQPDGALVRYYVTASDSHGSSESPLLAPDYDYGFRVGYKRPLIYLNELMARNETKLFDPDEPSEAPDWFELYNAGFEPVDLGGFYLTDDLASPRQYRIPEGTFMQPGEFMIFYADDDPEQGRQHVNFTLSGTGEVVGIYTPDGEVLVDSVSFGGIGRDRSYRRSVDGGGVWENGGCITPSEPNGCNQALYLPVMRR